MSGQIAMSPADIFVGMQNSEHTKRAYKNDISKWYQFVDATTGNETEQTALAFKDALIDIYAPATAQRIWCTVVAFYGWMMGTGKVDSSPFQGIKSPTRPTNEPPPVPSDEDVAALLRACDNGTSYGSRAALIITLLLNGLRAQEVADAKISNLKHDTATDAWILNVLGKGDKWRAVPLNSETQQAIFDYYLNRAPKSDYLIPNMDEKKPVDTQTIYRNVTHFARKAGVTGMHPHALRHHYATRLVRAGVDVFTLQKLLGHKRADTTQRYVALDYNDLSKAIELDPMHDKRFKHASLLYVTGQQEVDNAPVPF